MVWLENLNLIMKHSNLKSKNKFYISKSFIIVIFIGSILTYGVYSELDLFRSIYELGNNIRAQQDTDITAKPLELRYEIISTNKKIKGREISVEVTKGEKDFYSVMAIWVEDTLGNYIQTLYATKNIATGTFWKKENEEYVRGAVSRPEAVPYWLHKKNSIESKKSGLPTPENPLIDAITSATPQNHYVLQTSLSGFDIQEFKIFFEVNRSYDWNEYYNKKAFPDDKIYSGSGSVGQPSIVYSTDIIEINSNRDSYLMKPIGHGHHSGADGNFKFLNIKTC